MKFSVITTSLKRFFFINKFFKSLSNQKYQNFELIFIDQSGFDQRENLKLLNLKNLIYIKLKKNCLSGARNIALKYASGDYYLFIDDDCYFDHLFFYKLNISLKKNMQLLGFCIKNYTENIIVKKFYKKNFNFDYEIVKHLCSSNFAIKKNNKKFNSYLGLGSKSLAQSGEDTDYLLKNFNNKKYYYDKNISINHPKPIKKNNQKKIFFYSIGQSVVLLKNKLYIIFFVTTVKNFLSIFIQFQLTNLTYFIGKLIGFFYYYLIWSKKLPRAH